MVVGGGLRRSLHGLMVADLTEMLSRKFIIYIVLTVDLTAVTYEALIRGKKIHAVSVLYRIRIRLGYGTDTSDMYRIRKRRIG